MNRFSLLRTGSWVAVTAWAITIIILSSLSGPQVDKLNVFDLWDKGAHFLAFFVGAILVTNALRLSTQWSWFKIAIVAAVAISFFGATDEFHQRFTPKRRGADTADWLADTLGALTGSLLTIVIYARFQRKNCPAPSRN